MSLSARPEFHSIKKNLEIKSLLESGKKIHTRYGIFFLARDVHSTGISFAVLIKKSVGKAVWRNYCKRIVRSYIRNHSQKFLVFRRFIFLYNFHGKVSYNDLSQEFNKRLNTL